MVSRKVVLTVAGMFGTAAAISALLTQLGASAQAVLAGFELNNPRLEGEGCSVLAHIISQADRRSPPYQRLLRSVDTGTIPS